jgi:hypothetical protein
MSTIGSKLETSLAQAAAFAHEAARLRERQPPRIEAGRAVQDQLDLRSDTNHQAKPRSPAVPPANQRKKVSDPPPASAASTRDRAGAVRRIDLKA